MIDFIRRPDSMDWQAVDQLTAQIEEYPYFHAARILLLQALHKQHSPLYDQELRRNAVMVPCRNTIFHLTEEAHYKVKEERKRYDSGAQSDGARQSTGQLIDDFLGTLPHAQEPDPGVPADATKDYISYMLQTEHDSTHIDTTPMNGGGVVEQFLEQGDGRIPLPADTATKGDGAAEKPERKTEGKEIFTEIMAGIYIKQGKYESAAKIIRQLSLKYPKKNRYFADQLRFLEKLIINEKNK
ncbi:MAG TPA: hypothetical protein DDW22_01920 [Prevotellaceae bacterium]|nr:hypothetical protein [Prevotellaceae bacterium]